MMTVIQLMAVIDNNNLAVTNQTTVIANDDSDTITLV